MRWYLRVLGRYATFGGRARRREFWTFLLVNVLVATMLRLVDAGLGTDNLFRVSPYSTAHGIGVFSGVYALAVLVPTLAVGARRLQDTGRSGWWQLVMLAYPVTFVPTMPTMAIGGVVAFLVGIALIVWWAFDGESGPNRYGPDPKAVEPSAV